MPPLHDDEGGRVVRRLAMFSFITLVKERDTSLKAKILDAELPSIVLKSIETYHALRELVQSRESRPMLDRRRVRM